MKFTLVVITCFVILLIALHNVQFGDAMGIAALINGLM